LAWRANLALTAASLVVSFLAVEVAYRLAAGVPVLTASNWRQQRMADSVFRLGGVAIHDPVLGWGMRAGVKADGFNTLEHGVRANFGETGLRTGGVLAVGDSFTAGSEVRDEESWPAQLERLIGEPVINGAIGGYGTDQIVLRAEQLIPVVRPHTVILGVLVDDIRRAGFSSLGQPKPYFRVVGGRLEQHPPAPPAAGPGPGAALLGAVFHVLGYSAVVNRVMTSRAPFLWHQTAREGYHRTGEDVVAITCRLLERLQRKARAQGIRPILFLQHGGVLILKLDRPYKDAQQVMDCARAAGIEVVDEHPSLRAITIANPLALRGYYVMHGGEYGHMSAKGNAHAAALLAAAIRAGR
jgi:hypothetical protein